MGVWGEFEDCHRACQCLVVIFELMGNRLWFCMSFFECLSEQQSNILLAITCLQVRGLNCLCDLPTPNVLVFTSSGCSSGMITLIFKRKHMLHVVDLATYGQTPKINCCNPEFV